MRRTWTTALLGVLVASRAAAVSFPARSGETGILDVPDGELVGFNRGQIATEFRLDHAPGYPNDVGPLPFYLVSSFLPRLDVGGSVREWGQAGDARPAKALFGAAAKLQLVAPGGPLPALAISSVLDRINERPLVAVRLAASTQLADLRLAAFAGGQTRPGFDGFAPAGGLAATYALPRDYELAAELTRTPLGTTVGAAVRRQVTPVMGLAAGATFFPDDRAFRFFVGVSFATPTAKRAAEETPAAPLPTTVRPAQTGPRFTDARPHFRLRMPVAGPARLGQPRSLQYGPYSGPSVAAAASPAKPAAGPAKAAAPSLDDLAEAQLREQESLVDVRERRVRATSEQLDAREKAALEQAKAAEQRERELATREQQLDARERMLPRRGPPTQQQRQLESLEAQLAAQERQLGALERSLGPTVDAATGRERDAAARESAERQEASRLAASVSGTSSRAAQLEIRKQALGARNRQLAALEGQLVAKGERIDALERQLRARGERLDAWSRRLNTRAERLDTLEKANEPKPAPAAPKPAEQKAAAPKDKAAFVMVVKSPTAIVKERPAAGAAAAPGAAMHPGVAVEKAVAAATVVTFPTPATAMSELDRETIDNIARLAAKERCEMLIWARAKDPGLMAEAQRRADEIRSRVIAAGPLDGSQVVTRITTRPGAQGVDVVVSALRETSKPAAAAPAAPAAPALLSGESGKRQIRDAVVAAQPAIEACVGEHLERRRLDRAEGVLKLTISTGGKARSVVTGGGELSGAELDACISRVSGAWAFPAADGEYVVDVPITVIRGGTAK